MKTIILIGSAPCVIDDLCHLAITFEHELKGVHYAAIGLSGVMVTSWPLSYIASYHIEDIPQIKEIEPDAPIVSYIQEAGVDIVIPFTAPSGSSALLGALAGLKLGYDRIILAGCPLIGRSSTGDDITQFQVGWKAQFETVKDNVRSCSGWTAEFLGEPSSEWLQ